eukprot:12726099-Alexandrium_andersonii.AAC.1
MWLGKAAPRGAGELERPLAVTARCPGPAPGGSGPSPGRTLLRSFTRRRQPRPVAVAGPVTAAAAQGVVLTPKSGVGPAVCLLYTSPSPRD